MKKGPFSLKKRTLIALACAGALAAPVASNAQLVYNYKKPDYCGAGSCDMDFSGRGLTIQFSLATGIGRGWASGAANGNISDVQARNYVWTGLSWIRFSGSRLIGDGFVKSTAFAIESGVNLDTGSTATGAGILGTRDTGVGIDTEWGSVWFGKWYSSYNSSTIPLNVTTSTVGAGTTNSGVMGNPGFGAGTAYAGNGTAGASLGQAASLVNAMSFSRTQANTLQYMTPQWNGISARATYGANEEVAAGGAALAPVAKPSMYSGVIRYDNGPIVLGFGYERHNDYLWGGLLTANAFGVGSTAAGTGTTSKDTGMKVFGRYVFGDTTIAGIYERLEWNQSGGTAALTQLKANHYYLSLRQRLGGPHQIVAAYANAGSYSCTTTVATACRGDSGAKFMTFAYLYAVDKYTNLMFSYGRLVNDTNANYSSGVITTAAGAAGAVNTAGSTQQAVNLGIGTTF